ncbi:MAG: AMP-binding protein [Acidobacteriota bacterium]|nr:AMP-binding protein [Acidobacteriota bacterium]MDQ7088329.1 AMP-binding protein [Acidobacteriota bacterium]
MRRTMVDLVDRMQLASPEHRLTLVDARGRSTVFTWRDLHRKILAHASWLAAAGIQRGDRVIVCPTNDPDVLASFLALFYLGAIPFCVSGAQLGQSPGSQLPFVASLVNHAGARAIFAQAELVARNDEEGLIDPEYIIDHVPSSLDAESITPPPRARVTEDELAFVQFSSGSTSQPKGVRISHRNVIDNVRLLVEVGRRHPDEAGVAWLPLYHDMGLIATLFATLWHYPRDATLLNPIRFLLRPISWIEAISRSRARASICPNFALDLCTDRIRRQQLRELEIDLSCLEYLYVGAEPVRPSTLQRFREKFEEFGLGPRVLRPVYGLAEATLVVTCPDLGEEIITRTIDGIEVPSVGRPLGDFRLRIVDESGADVPTGEIGEVWLKGTSVTAGYLDESANKRLFSDGWLRTGDLGTLDEAGRLYITGRLKDLIIINGKNFYAHDIVAELEQLPFFERGKVHVFSIVCDDTERVVLLSVPLGKMTPAVKAKIKIFQHLVKRGGPHGWIKNIPEQEAAEWVEKLVSSDARELINEVKRYVLAKFGVPLHDIVFVNKIPRTTSGKVRREDCERLYLEQRRS